MIVGDKSGASYAKSMLSLRERDSIGCYWRIGETCLLDYEPASKTWTLVEGEEDIVLERDTAEMILFNMVNSLCYQHICIESRRLADALRTALDAAAPLAALSGASN